MYCCTSLFLKSDIDFRAIECFYNCWSLFRSVYFLMKICVISFYIFDNLDYYLSSATLNCTRWQLSVACNTCLDDWMTDIYYTELLMHLQLNMIISWNQCLVTIDLICLVLFVVYVFCYIAYVRQSWCIFQWCCYRPTSSCELPDVPASWNCSRGEFCYGLLWTTAWRGGKGCSVAAAAGECCIECSTAAAKDISRKSGASR